jgi:hypothetical protein
LQSASSKGTANATGAIHNDGLVAIERAPFDLSFEVAAWDMQDAWQCTFVVFVWLAHIKHKDSTRINAGLGLGGVDFDNLGFCLCKKVTE